MSRFFAIDFRSLAAFRVGVAGLVLADLALRAADLREHYSEEGVLPRADLLAHPVGRWLRFFSLHLLGDSVEFQALLFGLAALLALGMALGYRTRFCAVAVWVLTLSLQNRNPLLHYGGDNFLALMLFWCALLPLGARYSLDSARGRGAPPGTNRVLSWASAGLLIQIAVIYFFSALHKTGPEWLPDGTAIFYVLHLEQFAFPLAFVLREFDGALRLGTYGSHALELLAPLLFFAPRYTTVARLVGAASIFAFHLGIALTVYLVLFNWIGMLTVVVFLPAWFWDELLPRLRGRGRERPLLASLRQADGRAPTGAALPQSRGLSVAAALALAFIVFWNTATLNEGWREAIEGQPVLRWVTVPGLALRLGQTWSMFSPSPPRQTTWYVIVGVRGDGTRVDLQRGGAPLFDQPRSRADYNRSGRWERLLTYGPKSEYAEAYRGVAGYYCRAAGADPESGTALARVQIFRRILRTRLEGEPVPDRQRLVYRMRCP
ncbi:MAG: HTTM domain-containing protein [Proteobacteria bacterium]|nr:HTTM domain-containing protein [Pseudomonadota bacterium]